MRSPVESLIRQMLVVGKLQRASMAIDSDSLLDYLENECRYHDCHYPMSREARMRMLQRDIQDIARLFRIYIEWTAKGYEIVDRDNNHVVDYERFFADFELLTALSPETEISKYVLPERSHFVGSRHLSPLLIAIKKNLEVEFDYTNYRKDKTLRHHIVNPYFLKEDQRRWYLVGVKENKPMIFALDRISSLDITGESFERDTTFSLRDYFRDSFGIWVSEEIPVEEVELSYSALDGSFLKTVPLHPSQTVVADNEKEFRIIVRLRVTNDFIMALLSRSGSLSVVRPLWLREKIRRICEEAALRNS